MVLLTPTGGLDVEKHGAVLASVSRYTSSCKLERTLGRSGTHEHARAIKLINVYDTLAPTRNSTDMPFLSFSASASPSAFLRIRRLDSFSVSLGGGTDDSNQTMTGTGSVNGMRGNDPQAASS